MPNICKQVLGELPMVYAVCVNRIGNQPFYMAATELHGPCYAYSPPHHKPIQVWDRPGGVMSLIAINDGTGRALAIQRAWPIYHFDQACVVDIKPSDASGQQWQVAPVLDLPFAHRVMIFGQWVIGATLANAKAAQEDWTVPGKVVAAPLTQQWGTPLEAQTILDGIRRNHGMNIVELDGKPRLMVSGIDGLFAITAPSTDQPQWQHERLLDHDVSDMAVFDIDGDGHPELITIEPFHGDRLVIYKRSNAGQWQPAYEHAIRFGHVVWAGLFTGQPTLLIGNRAGDKDLYMLRPKQPGSLDMTCTWIDRHTGPANIAVIQPNLILAANHALGEVALYEVNA